MPDESGLTIRSPREMGQTRTSQTREIRDIVVGTAELRSSTSDLHSEATALDEAVLALELDNRASALAQEDVGDLLATAREGYGLTWEDLAGMIGVSSAALRKWRRGEQVSAQNRHHLAKALAFCELLGRRDPRITDVAQWLTEPFLSSTELRGLDLYGANYASQLLSVARGQTTRTALLDMFDPNWRNAQAADARWGVEIAVDGQPIIVERTPSGGSGPRPAG
jgi:transcriptional regulator with XRE-family HTH domain